MKRPPGPPKPAQLSLFARDPGDLAPRMGGVRVRLELEGLADFSARYGAPAARAANAVLADVAAAHVGRGAHLKAVSGPAWQVDLGPGIAEAARLAGVIVEEAERLVAPVGLHVGLQVDPPAQRAGQTAVPPRH